MLFVFLRSEYPAMATFLPSLIDMTHAMARLRIRKLIRLVKAYCASTKMEAKATGEGGFGEGEEVKSISRWESELWI